MRRSTFLIRQHVPFNPSRGPSPRDRKKHARKAAVCRVRIETVGKEEDITPRPSTGVSFPRKGFATGTINKQLLLTLVLAADLDTRSIDRSVRTRISHVRRRGRVTARVQLFGRISPKFRCFFRFR